MGATTDAGGSLKATTLIGIALMAAIDEIVFHQLLSWHHLYDRSTSKAALFSDGLLHLTELLALGAGAVLLARLGYRHALAHRWAWAGLFLGLGGFQLFDGVVNHKVLRLHQIRYGVERLWPYDVVWNAGGLALLMVGLVLLRRARTKTAEAASGMD